MTPGTVIANKYRVIRALGEGGMGSVWEAVNLLTDRHFALKLMHREGGKAMTDRMLREARAAGRLQHPNVIEVYDVGATDEGEPFLVLELLTGQTVESLLQQRIKLDVVRATAVGVEVARALSAAHAAGIVHRDLKPANVFLHEEARSRRVKVVDFGVSKSLTGTAPPATVAGVPIGTPAYMSPEQAEGSSKLDYRTDLWSLGVLLFEMVTGRLPYQGLTAHAIVGELLRSDRPRVRELVPDIDPRFDQIVARCLERDPTRRIGSARELTAELESLLTKPTDAILRDLDEDATLSRREQAPPVSAPSAAPEPTEAAPPAITRARTRTLFEGQKPWVLALVALAGLAVLSLIIVTWIASSRVQEPEVISSEVLGTTPAAASAAPSAVVTAEPASGPATASAPAASSAPPKRPVKRLPCPKDKLLIDPVTGKVTCAKR